ncbi:hypothetical protein [Acidipila sp. EB88]|uniref:hypothetical protein n=1 Tax=Acidipila sp. EB88 TaxID=2305226 RepID=UPI0018F580F4|nr:hypothetical protein [Acidipila sp. EB88]
MGWQGVNFALFSAHATKVELCLFSDDGKEELQRLALPEHTNEVWHGYIPGLAPGSAMGTGSTAPMSRKMDIASITTSSCSTPTPTPTSAR